MTLDQLKSVLRARKQEFLKLTKLVQNKFNFTHSASYDPEVMSVRSNKSVTSTQSGTGGTRGKLFLKAKNASTCWNHIKSSSENAFNVRKKCEQVSLVHCQLDTDIMKLSEKKKYLENLVAAEKQKFGNIREQNSEAHVKMRNMQRDLARKAVH